MERTPRRLLALDAAGGTCSAAVWVEGNIVAAHLERMARGQSEALVPMLAAVLAEAGLAFSALDAIAVTLGPGGFTGVRIGLAAAEGAALAWNLPLVGVSSFEAAAAAVPAEERAGRHLVVVLDAKRAELYAAAWGPAKDVTLAPCLLAPPVLADALPAGPLLLAGDAVEQALPALATAGRDLLVSRAARPVDAAVVARLAAAQPLPPAGVPLRPLYLRAPDTTLPGRRKPAPAPSA